VTFDDITPAKSSRRTFSKDQTLRVASRVQDQMDIETTGQLNSLRDALLIESNYCLFPNRDYHIAKLTLISVRKYLD